MKRQIIQQKHFWRIIVLVAWLVCLSLICCFRGKELQAIYITNQGYISLVEFVEDVDEKQARNASVSFQRAIILERNARAYQGIGILAGLQGNYREALDDLTFAEQLSPPMPILLYQIGNLWEMQGNHPLALENWRKAHAEVRFKTEGDAYLRSNDLEAARNKYELAVAVNPTWEPARQALGRTLHGLINNYWSSGRREEALVLLNRVIELAPNKWDYILLGDYASDQGDVEGAQRWYETGALQYPNDPILYFRLGQLAYQRMAYSESVAQFLTATELDPNYAAAYLWLGTAYLAQGELDLAKQALLTKINLSPDAWGYYSLGVVYFDMGRVEEACRAYGQALDFSPDLMQAKNQLKQLECVSP